MVPQSRNATSVRVRLGTVAWCFVIYMWLVFSVTLGAVSLRFVWPEHLQQGKDSIDSIGFLIGRFVKHGETSAPVVALVSGMTISLFAVVIPLATRQRVTLSETAVELTSVFRKRSLPISSLARLTLFKTSLSQYRCTLSSNDGREISIVVMQNRLDPRLEEILSELSRRTGKPWLGRGDQVSLGTFIQALRDATGRKTTGELLRWAADAAFWLRPDRAGIDTPLIRWGYGIVLTGLLLVIASISFFIGLSLSTGVSGVIPLMLAVLLGIMLLTLGFNVILTIVNLELRKRESLQAELAAAREIQARLLPAKPAVLQGYEISGTCMPAREVGGDYYDFIPLDGQALAVAVADVSGKGIAAGLVMTMTKGALSTRLSDGEAIPSTLAGVNRTIRDCYEGRMFVSMAVARLELSSGTIELTRAGHNPPLLMRTGQDGAEWLTPPGIALGLSPSKLFTRSCSSQSFEMSSGDCLLLYSDGLTEAMNPAAEEYGERRLELVVHANRNRSSDEMRAAILDDVSRFRSGAEPNDDLTLVVIRRTEPARSGILPQGTSIARC